MCNLLKVISLLTVLMAGCSTERIDFSKKLNYDVGKTLQQTDFDSALGRIGKKKLMFEDLSIFIFRYQLNETLCIWDVDVDKSSQKIVQWRYSNDAAKIACNDFLVKRGN
jgi:hypothetical protein